ncbi:hypothetical protein H5410_009066 [Solanum commersonii]|uniref:Uncharacterized protein n=1 Tax=Solanum commersonii TaxID=4109 RepID=A0A9J6AGY6_SOLCO|nr:hypothetical protein H5410_009066 [Solanum commersonii]
MSEVYEFTIRIACNTWYETSLYCEQEIVEGINFFD